MPQAIKPDPRAVIVEANETAVSYWPAFAWTNNEDDAIYTARSYRFTTRQGARATFVFTGSEVWFYSDRNHNHGIFSATIDGNPAQNFSGVAPSLVTQQLLFTTKVEPGPHNLIIINEDSLPFGVDYFAYMPLDDPSPTTASSEPTATATATPAARSSSVDTWIWLTFVIGLVAIIIGLIISFFIYRSRMRKKYAEGLKQRLGMQYRKEGYAQLDVEMHPPPTPWYPPSSSTTPPAYVPPQSTSQPHSVQEPDPVSAGGQTSTVSDELRPLSVPGRSYVAPGLNGSPRTRTLNLLREPASTSSSGRQLSNHARGASTSSDVRPPPQLESPQSTLPPYDGRRAAR